MALAIAVFLGVIPCALVAMAGRRPGEGSLRRLEVTVFGHSASPASRAVIARRLRRYRLFGAVGAVCALWATAGWQSTTWTWNGLLSSLPLTQHGIAPGVGELTLAGGSFLLRLNVFGVLTGFATGLLLGEWAGDAPNSTMRRAALLTHRSARNYLTRAVRAALAVVAVSALAALAVTPLLPQSAVGPVRPDPGPWWAVALIGVAVAALATRAAVLGSALHAETVDLVAAREGTLAVTTATLTIVALAGFTGSAASTLGRLSSWYGWGWGDGTATLAIALSLVATGLVIAAFLTPYWAVEVGGDVDVAAARQ